MRTLIRSLLERLSRGRIIRRRLPERFGSQPIYVSPDSMLSFWRRDLEAVAPELFRWVDELVSPGSKIWDIGANVGLFTLAAACRAGRDGVVVACEPDPWLAAIIRRSVTGLPATWAKVEVCERAVSAVPGEVRLVIGRRGRASNFVLEHGGNTQVGGTREILHVPATTLEECSSVYGPPDLIKIDVEGAEASVLAGGERLLESASPELLIEVTAQAATATARHLRASGYRLFDAEAVPCWGREVPEPTWNTLASRRRH